MLDQLCEEVAVQGQRLQEEADGAKWQQIKDACDGVGQEEEGGSACVRVRMMAVLYCKRSPDGGGGAASASKASFDLRVRVCDMLRF